MNWVLLRNSLLVGGCTTLLSVGFGLIAALWLAGLSGRWRTTMLAAAITALALPPFLVTNCWLHFLGKAGVGQQALLSIFSVGGTVWILSLLLWPLSLLLIWGSWQRLEAAQLESDLLVKGWALQRALLLPLARNALLQCVLLTFVLAANNFAVPAILQVKVFPAEMWIRFNTELDTSGALRLSYPLMVGPVLLVIWLLRREFPWPHVQTPVPGRLFRQQLGPVWFWSCGICSLALLLCSLALPLFQIMSAPRTWSELPGALAAGHDAIWHSFWYAAAAATVIVGISLFIIARFEGRRWNVEGRNPKAEIRKKSEGRNPKEKSSRDAALAPSPPSDGGEGWGEEARSFVCKGSFAIVSRNPNRGRISGGALRILRAAGWLPFLLPGVLLGIRLIQVFNHDWSAFFYQSAGIVILAFVIRYLVIGWQVSVQAAQRVDRDLIDVALIEGATPWQMLRHVLWPQIARPVLVAWYIVFLLCLWDVESMILVVPPGGETLALRIFNLLHYGHNAQVNALCLILLGVALVPLILGKLAQAGHWIYRDRPYSARTLLSLGFTIFLAGGCSPPADNSVLRSEIFDKVQIIGSRGVGVGQLNKPRSVAVDSSDNVYVIDMTGRVQKFSSNGVFLLSWQMPQTDLGKPKGMGRDRQGNILLVEPHYSRVNVFSPLGKLLTQWGTHGTNVGQLSMPRAVAVDSRSEVFVSEYQEIERVQKFVFDTNKTGPISPPHWSESFGHAGTEPGEFNRPEGLCVDALDRVYVADSCNHRIQVFTSEGKFLRAYGKAGSGPGELSYPYDICVDEQGRQYVCEFGNSRIQVFDAHDKPIEIIGGPGAEPGRFNNPWGVALDSAGNLYVADSQNHRVQKLRRRR